MIKQSAFFKNGYIQTNFQFFHNKKSQTFMTWIKFANCESEIASTVLGQRGGVWQGRVQLYSSSSKRLSLFSPNLGGENYSKSTFQNNKWYHIAVTLNHISQQINVYINGVLEITCNINGELSATPTCIGGYPETSYVLNGYMTEIKFYNYSMSEQEIISKMSKKENKNNPTLLGYYNFEDDLLDSANKIITRDKNVTISPDFPDDIKSNKFLIKQNQSYYTIKPKYYSDGKFIPIELLKGDKPNAQDYENFGFDDINVLGIDMIMNTETFKPIDKLKQLGNNIEILKCVEK